MAKKEAPKLETERLILRRRLEEDIPSMMKLFNDDQVRQYLGGYPPCDRHSMLRIIRYRTPVEWHVLDKKTGRYMGECGLNKVVDDYLGEVSYLFLPRYWGKGYAQEAMEAVISHCRDNLQLKRLCAMIDQKNERSRKLAEKLNFALVALIPEGDFGGRVADIAYYARPL